MNGKREGNKRGKSPSRTELTSRRHFVFIQQLREQPSVNQSDDPPLVQQPKKICEPATVGATSPDEANIRSGHACHNIQSVHQDPQQPTAHRIHPVILVVVVEENQRSRDCEVQLLTRTLEGEIVSPCGRRLHFPRRSQHPKWPAMPASSYTRSIRIRSNRRRIASIQSSWW